MSVAHIKEEVDKIVNANKKKIILGLYSNMIKNHNDFCDCDYCSILKTYVSLKKRKSRMYRDSMYGNGGYGCSVDFDAESELYAMGEFRLVEIRIKELKLEKNQIKKEIISKIWECSNMQ